MGPVDIVIPAHEKDLPTLRQAVRAALRHVSPLRRMYVVARDRFHWPGDRVVWVPEPSPPLFPGLDDVRASWPASSTAGRASWIYQQMLKLGAPEYIDGLSQQFLVLDSDVVFLRPVSFDMERDKHFVYSLAYEYHAPYRAAYGRLFGRPPSTGQSLTAHHMLYDCGLLAEMKNELEQRHGRRWYDAYLDAVDFDAESSMSEMDVYGWWVLDRHSVAAYRRQLIWRDVRLVPGILGRAVLAADFDFVAAHAWFRQGRLERIVGLMARLAAELWAASPPARRREYS